MPDWFQNEILSIYQWQKKSFLSDKSQPRQSFCRMFVCCSKRIPLAGLESGDEALLVLHQLRFYPVFIIFEILERLWFSQTNLHAHASCLRHLCFPTWPPANIYSAAPCLYRADISAWKHDAYAIHDQWAFSKTNSTLLTTFGQISWIYYLLICQMWWLRLIEKFHPGSSLYSGVT